LVSQVAERHARTLPREVRDDVGSYSRPTARNEHDASGEAWITGNGIGHGIAFANGQRIYSTEATLV